MTKVNFIVYINYENFLINEEIGDLSKENTIFEGVGHFQAKTEENPNETTAEDENPAENTAENTNKTPLPLREMMKL